MIRSAQLGAGQRNADWLNSQIETYPNLKPPAYQAFASLLTAVLGQVKREESPLAFVGIRIKQVGSLAWTGQI